MKPFLVSFALATMACGGAADEPPVEQTDVAISVTETSAVRRGTNTFALKTASDATAVDVTAWMPSMGHGAPSDPRVVKEADGSFRLEDVVFSMPGTWELKVNVACPTRHATRTFSFDVR